MNIPYTYQIAWCKENKKYVGQYYSKYDKVWINVGKFHRSYVEAKLDCSLNARDAFNCRPFLNPTVQVYNLDMGQRSYD